MMGFLARLYDLPNAFRVIDIMDRAGCDIEQVNRPGWENSGWWEIKPKWYVSQEDAEDLRRIILYKYQYKNIRSSLWRLIPSFRRFRSGCRILPSWFRRER